MGEPTNSSTGLFLTVNEKAEFLLETREQGLRRARALLRKYIPEGVNLFGRIDRGPAERSGWVGKRSLNRSGEDYGTYSRKPLAMLVAAFEALHLRHLRTGHGAAPLATAARVSRQG